MVTVCRTAFPQCPLTRSTVRTVNHTGIVEAELLPVQQNVALTVLCLAVREFLNRWSTKGRWIAVSIIAVNSGRRDVLLVMLRKKQTAKVKASQIQDAAQWARTVHYGWLWQYVMGHAHRSQKFQNLPIQCLPCEWQLEIITLVTTKTVPKKNQILKAGRNIRMITLTS